MNKILKKVALVLPICWFALAIYTVLAIISGNPPKTSPWMLVDLYLYLGFNDLAKYVSRP